MGVALVFSIAILMAWVLLIAVGLLALRSGRRGLGVAFIVLGGLWGLLVLLWAGYDTYSLRGMEPRGASSTAFDPQTHEGPTGAFTLDWHRPSTLNVREKLGSGKYKVKSQDGALRLPVGTYTVESWNAEATDDKGLVWLLETRYPKSPETIKAKAEGTTALPYGSGLHARITTASAPRGAASFEFTLKDAAGNTYSLMSRGQKAQPPGFEVTDQSGQVVWSGKFEYG